MGQCEKPLPEGVLQAVGAKEKGKRKESQSPWKYRWAGGHPHLLPISSERLQALGRSHGHRSKNNFSEILIFASKFGVYHWQQILSVVSPGDTLSFIFKKTSDKY